MENIRVLLKNKWIKASFITFIAIVFSTIIYLIGLLDNLELKSYDLRFKARGDISTEDSDILIVAIDDQTFNALQKNWPFPRSYFAKAIRNLTEAGVKLIIIDVTFTEPSATDIQQDSILAQAISVTDNVILAGKIAVEFGSHDIVNKYILKPIKLLLNAGAKWGYANIGHDPDGFIRRYNLFQPNEKSAYLSLGIDSFLDAYRHFPGDNRLGLGNTSYVSDFLNCQLVRPWGTFTNRNNVLETFRSNQGQLGTSPLQQGIHGDGSGIPDDPGTA